MSGAGAPLDWMLVDGAPLDGALLAQAAMQRSIANRDNTLHIRSNRSSRQISTSRDLGIRFFVQFFY